MTYDELECYCKWLTDRYNKLEKKHEKEISERDQTIKDIQGRLKTETFNLQNIRMKYMNDMKEFNQELRREEEVKELRAQIKTLRKTVQSLQTANSRLASLLPHE